VATLTAYLTVFVPYHTSAVHLSTKAHPAKAGVAKPRVLASSETPLSLDAPKDPKTAGLPLPSG
jgi:hypothetical protein